MTASASTLPRRAAADPLRTVEAALLGTLFLGVVAMLSPPAVTAGPGWIPLWLVGAPVTALATSFLLRLRRSGSPAPATTALMRRRPAMATRRRASPPQIRANRIKRRVKRRNVFDDRRRLRRILDPQITHNLDEQFEFGTCLIKALCHLVRFGRLRHLRNRLPPFIDGLAI